MAGDHKAYVQWMRKAIQHSQRSEWTAAAEAYRRALSEFPTDLAATIGIGKSWVGMGQLQLALKAFERATQLAPGDRLALESLADVQERLGSLQEAAATYYRLAELASQGGDSEAAASAWTRVVRLAPERIEAHQRLISTLERLGRHRQAAMECVSLASIYERRKEREKARACYQEALRLDTDNSLARARLEALSSFEILATGSLVGTPPSPDSADKTTGDAVELLNFDDIEDEGAMVKDDPFERARRRALQKLADTLFAAEDKDSTTLTLVSLISQAIDRQTRGQLDDAIEFFRRALGAGYNDTALSFNLGCLYYERQRYEDAIEAFRHSMRNSEFALGSHYALGLTCWAAGMVDRALEHFLEVIRTVDLAVTDPEKIQEMNLAYQRLTDRYLARRDSQEAKTFVNTLTRFFSHPHWELLAQQARHNMDRVAAREAPRTLAEYLQSPETGLIVDTMALVEDLVEHNMLATAMEQCIYAISRAPDHLPLYVRLAELQTLQGYHEQASALYMSIIDSYRVRGDLRQAFELCRAVLEQSPMDVNARSKLITLLSEHGGIDVEEILGQYLILADTYYQLADLDRALEKYEEALRLVARSSQRTTWEVQILRRMGDIFIQRVDWIRATWAYESIVALLPDDEQARLRLVDLYLKQRRSEAALQSLDRLCESYYTQGKFHAIPDVLRELIRVHPDEMGLRARAAELYAAQGLTKQAIAEYTALSRLQLEAGLRDKARKTLETILKLGPEQPELYQRLLIRLQGGSVPSVS